MARSLPIQRHPFPPRGPAPCKALLALVVCCICLAWAQPCKAADIPLPPPLDAMLDFVLGVPPNIEPGTQGGALTPPQTIPARPKTPQSVLPLFIGIPYRLDGVINDDGQYALFNAPDTSLATPGLNCSGMVLAASRIILDTNFPVAAMVRDREGDSGPAAPYGHDWDFGFDLVMNISEGFSRRVLLPPGAAVPDALTGKTAPSFDPHAPGFTDALLPQVTEGLLYLVSFSRHRAPDAPPRLHYHTGVIVRDGNAVWVYSTTRNSGRVIRHNLATPDGLARFRDSFKNTPGSYKRLTVLAVLIAD